MLFYLLIAFIVVTVTGGILLMHFAYVEWPIFVASITSFIAVFIWVALFFGYTMSTGPTLSEVRHPLKAIGTTDTVRGQLYLGGGYIEGQKTLSYIEEQSGKDGTWSVVDSAYASDSRIFEGEDDPYVLVRTVDSSNYFISPWQVHTTDEYDFHVPAGSVQSNYEVTAK